MTGFSLADWLPPSEAPPAVYLDCNATTPIDPEVLTALAHFNQSVYGNPAQPAYAQGRAAALWVAKARSALARVVEAQPEEVVFTSGGTESNNLAILGSAEAAWQQGRRHIVCSSIEHPAVYQPVAHLAERGFTVDWLPVDQRGWVTAAAVRAAVRHDTFLVTVMQVNNETGIQQPIEAIADVLAGQSCLFHVDAAQGFAKSPAGLNHSRIDMISMSGHKLFAPKGIGALIVRNSAARSALQPRVFGGNQEGGLRSGTLPVPLIGALGVAVDLAMAMQIKRRHHCARFGDALRAALAPLNPVWVGDATRRLPHVACVVLPGIDAEEALTALSPVIAVSRGSACAAGQSEDSHVLRAMGLAAQERASALRFSWCHQTPDPDWSRVVDILSKLR